MPNFLHIYPSKLFIFLACLNIKEKSPKKYIHSEKGNFPKQHLNPIKTHWIINLENHTNTNSEDSNWTSSLGVIPSNDINEI